MKTLVIMGYLAAIGFAVGGTIIMGIGIYRASFPTQEGAAAAIGIAIAVIPLTVAFSIDRIVHYQTPSQAGKGTTPEKKGKEPADEPDGTVDSGDDN